jgi:hypothetical protein
LQLAEHPRALARAITQNARHRDLCVVVQDAESGATRTPIPAQGGQHSGDCGQQVMAA